MPTHVGWQKKTSSTENTQRNYCQFITKGMSLRSNECSTESFERSLFKLAGGGGGGGGEGGECVGAAGVWGSQLNYVSSL